jgi:soluble lytic murein transglycosylase
MRFLSLLLSLGVLGGMLFASTDCAHKNAKAEEKKQTAADKDDNDSEDVFVRLISVVPTTTTLAPPSPSPSKEMASLDLPGPSLENLALVYLKAKSLEDFSPVEACQIYLGLAKEKDFPLATISLLKAHLICEHPESLPDLPKNLISDFPWLEEMDVVRQVREYTLQKNAAKLAAALLRRSQLSDRIPEKVEFLRDAEVQATQAMKENKNDKSTQKLLGDIQARLYRLAPRYIPHPTHDDYFRVGTDLVYQRKFAQGRKYFHRILKEKKFSADEKYIARRALRNSFKTEQNLNEYLRQATQFARWCEKMASPGRAYEAALILARAQWTQGKIRMARKTLDRAEKLFKGRVPSLEEVYYVRGKMFEEEHKYTKAIQTFTLGEKESKPNSAYHDRILFSKAWVLLKTKKNKEAAESFKAYRDSTSDPFEKNKASFWYARSLRKAGDKNESQKEFRSLAEEDPVGFYGLVAYRELSQDMPPLSESSDSVDISVRPRGVSQKDHDLIHALMLVHEDDLLGAFLDDKTQELKAKKNLDQKEWLYFLKAYAQAGLYSPLFYQLGTLPADMKSKLLLQNPDLLFPRRYVDLVETWGQKFKVSPELMLSIIRQESSFNPFARSPADAFGLMQLLPSVAKTHLARVKIPIHHFSDLYKPEVNIPYGAALLADLQKKYRGQFVLTVAAYNANEKAISHWLSTRLQQDPLEFIEDIPYEETRAYIKLVLRNFIFYSRLASPRQTLAFPNHCLSDLHSFKVSTR